MAKPQKKPKPPVSTFKTSELDPLTKCGSRTTVQALYRVDESREGKTMFHLVFFDRHGWYCLHGADCPAVIVARTTFLQAK
jgi:hypothetical protein